MVCGSTHKLWISAKLLHFFKIVRQTRRWSAAFDDVSRPLDGRARRDYHLNLAGIRSHPLCTGQRRRRRRFNCVSVAGCVARCIGNLLLARRQGLAARIKYGAQRVIPADRFRDRQGGGNSGTHPLDAV